MKTNAFKAVMIVGLLTFIAIPTFTQAEDFSVGGGDVNGAAVAAAAVGGVNVNGATTNTSSNPANLSVGGTDVNGANGTGGLSVGGGNTNGAETNVSSSPADLSVGGQNVNGATTGNTSPDLSVGGVNVNGATTGNVPSNTGNNGNPAGNPGGSSGSVQTNFGTSGGVATNLPNLTSFGQCAYITSYMKLGGNNSVAEVTKLQNFLRGVEGINVTVTGVYDAQTVTAVEAFQAKYVNDVMLPWGVTTPTGQVYFTTKDKINEIYCRTNFSLTPAQIAEIEAYKIALLEGRVNENGDIISTSTPEIIITPEVGSATSTSSSNVAAVGETSFFGKVWNFIKGIFGR